MNDNDGQRHSSMCAAYGCPCNGSITSSGSGTNDWLCWQHHGADPGAWQRITAEMNRLSFIVEACKALRVAKGAKIELARELTIQVNAVMRQNQRSDLRYNHADDKHIYGWLERLEGVLSQAARGDSQRVIPAIAPKTDTWQKATFEMPEQEQEPAHA